MTELMNRNETSLVSVKKTVYEKPDTASLLAPLGGMDRFVKKGEKVLLKINLLSARGPEEGVTTHPEFVRSIIREVKKAGAIPFIADSPAGRYSKSILLKAYDKTGIGAMANEEGVHVNLDTGSKKVIIPDGLKVKRIPICNFIFDADKIIGIPKLKTHSLQYLTLACKNMYGAVPGLVKAKYHAYFPGKMAFGDFLLDIYSFLNPDLFIMDAVLGLHGQGPAGGGDPIDIGLSLASSDGIAIDIAACRLIGIEPAGVPLLKRAKIRGMWPDTVEYPLLNPEGNRIKGFKMPNTASHLQSRKKTQVKSPVVTDKCIGCGECKRICPKQVISLNDKAACIDYSECIRCYCCHEVCPVDAIRLVNIRR